MKRRALSTVGCGLLTLVLAGAAWADITSKPRMISAQRGAPLLISLDVDATEAEAVAGINGRLTYDPAIFHNPAIGLQVGAAGFTALGNEVAPGDFRFVIYANPTATMNLNLPVAEFNIDVDPLAPFNTTQTLSFDTSAAGSPEGQSFAAQGKSVSFADFVVNINANAAEAWAVYE